MWVGKRIFPVSRRYGGVAANHRPSSVLAFLCSCFPEGLPEGLGGRPGNGVLPHRECRSTDGEIADSPRRKTPLVLPCEGRDAGTRGPPNLRVQVLSLVGGRRSSSGERQRGSCVQGEAEGVSRRDEGVCEGVAARGSLRGAPVATGASPTGAPPMSASHRERPEGGLGLGRGREPRSCSFSGLLRSSRGDHPGKGPPSGGRERVLDQGMSAVPVLPRLLLGFALAWREEQIYPQIPALSGYRSFSQNRPMDP